MNNLSVIRGGSWFISPRSVRSDLRFRLQPGNRSIFVGFRLVVTTHSPYRALRGGSWFGYQADARAAARNRSIVNDRLNDFGFRLRFK